MFKKSQSGRSMIEMLGVLAIIGVLSVGGLAAYTKAMQTIRVNEATEYINRVRMELKTRKVTGGWQAGHYYLCSDWIKEDLPTGMTDCCIKHSLGRILIHFNSGNLLKEIAKKFNTSNWANISEEAIDAGTPGWSSYIHATGVWVYEYLDASC